MERERISTEVVRRIYLDDEGVFLEVGPGEEGLGIELRTTGKANEEYFGKIRLVLTHHLAAELGRALVSASNEAVDTYRKLKENLVR